MLPDLRFILSEDDRAAFLESMNRWRRGPDRRIYAVGYYRGHTRDGICLAAEDLALLEETFPEPTSIAMVVKPYATKVSMAGIFFREEGQFRADASHLEFPFRRKELGGGCIGDGAVDERGPIWPAARRRRSAVSDTGSRKPRASRRRPGRDRTWPAFPSIRALPQWQRQAPKGKGVRGGWVWIPLSFIFMLLGVVVGFQIALSMRPKQPANPWLEAWDMTLQVKKTGEELAVTWDPLAPAVGTPAAAR